MSKKIIRGFRTNMALYGLCLIVFVIVTIPFEPLLALAEAAVAQRAEHPVDPSVPVEQLDVLEKVRQVQAGEGVSATLSIGVGREAGSYDALFKNAGLALEMALSRGGDQAVVKDRMNFEFYGGRAKTTEKRAPHPKWQTAPGQRPRTASP